MPPCVTITVKASGEIVTMDGFAVNHDPWPHILVGQENSKRPFTRISLGREIQENPEKFPRVDSPCVRDGQPKMGKCPICGIVITRDKISKVITGKPEDQRLVSGVVIDCAVEIAQHATMKAYAPIKNAAFLRLEKKKKTILVPEFPNSRKDRVNVLIYAEALEAAHTASFNLEESVYDDRLQKPVSEILGERRASPNHPSGIGQERIFVLRRNDSIVVDRNFEPKKVKVIVTDKLELYSVIVTEKPKEPKPTIEVVTAKTQTAAPERVEEKPAATEKAEEAVAATVLEAAPAIQQEADTTKAESTEVTPPQS